MAPYKYDIVVFGATGFTGQRVVEHLIKWQAEPDQTKFTFAVAGRNEARLKSLLAKVKYEEKGVGVIVADVANPESIKQMCEAGKVLLNCVGPYRFYGEEVVKQCVQAGCHYLDISGEPQFLESMQLKYNGAAEEKKVLVVSSCGFDSIPCDLGVLFTRKQFEGDVNAIESFIEVHTGQQGSRGHFATFQSAIYGFAHGHELKPIRKSLFTERLPKYSHRLKNRGSAFHSEEVDGWCIPFPGSDRSVVKRTQYYLFTKKQQKPIQFSAYAKVGSIFNLIQLMFFGLIFSLLSKFSFGRSLLESYPGFFTKGMFTHEGPSEEQMASTSFSIVFLGQGYSSKLSDPHELHEGKATVRKSCVVRGPEPGYVATPICLISAAMAIITDRHSLPEQGGVLTPGAAFHSSNTMFQLLEKHGVTFQVLSNNE